MFNQKIVELDVKQELYQRYADDINQALRAIGRKMKLCHLTGCMVEKVPEQINAEEIIQDYELTMREMKQIADSIMKNIETEYDSPSIHPELDMKVPVLDLAIWVEQTKFCSPGMDGQGLHFNFRDCGGCLPIGEHKESLREQRLEEERVPASRIVHQVKYEFFSKPMAPHCILCSALGAEENDADTRAHSETSQLQQRAELQNEDKASD